MVYKCAAFGCRSGYDRIETPDDVTFHKFPITDPELLDVWRQRLGRRNFRPTHHSRLCSLHFAPEDFQLERTDSHATRLKRAANPLLRNRRLKPHAAPQFFDSLSIRLARRNGADGEFCLVCGSEKAESAYFLWPTEDSKLLQCWCRATKIPLTTLLRCDPSSSYRICEDHFQEAFIDRSSPTPTLFPGAIPTFFNSVAKTLAANERDDSDSLVIHKSSVLTNVRKETAPAAAVKEKGRVCSLCHTKFGTLRELLKHRTAVHRLVRLSAPGPRHRRKVEAPTETMERWVELARDTGRQRCPDCSLFIKSDMLEEHRLTAHSEEQQKLVESEIARVLQSLESNEEAEPLKIKRKRGRPRKSATVTDQTDGEKETGRCSRSSRRRRLLSRDQQRFPCQECEIKFSTPVLLEKHNIDVHSVDN